MFVSIWLQCWDIGTFDVQESFVQLLCIKSVRHYSNEISENTHPGNTVSLIHIYQTCVSMTSLPILVRHLPGSAITDLIALALRWVLTAHGPVHWRYMPKPCHLLGLHSWIVAIWCKLEHSSLAGWWVVVIAFYLPKGIKIVWPWMTFEGWNRGHNSENCLSRANADIPIVMEHS